MARIRRSAFAFLYLEDDYRIDVASIVGAGTPGADVEARVVALALLTGEQHRLSPAELAVLRAVPANRWVDDDPYDRDAVGSLIGAGLVVGERRRPRLRRREEALAANEWNLYAALYHFMTQWSGIDIGAQEAGEFRSQARAAALAYAAEHGPPPDAFADVATDAEMVPLPGIERDGELYRTLLARRTARAFDPEMPMSLEALDTVLRYVFGAHGHGTTVADVVSIKRTSPSGGALHPVEAYPVISNVSGVAPGIYRYSVRDHALVRLTSMTSEEARTTAAEFMCGQGYFGAAHVSFVLTARFYRNHWKYRRHQKAYAGMLMDAAHLSQTLYLVSADLGLGAFVTIAINGRDIERRLHLDGVGEGVLAMAGCGPRLPGPSPLELEFRPGVPPAPLTPP